MSNGEKLRKKLKKSHNRKFLARDFDGFRNQILEYANLHFPDKIQDFSDGSFAGLLVDMAAIVGDSLSFYLDHQFNELDPNSAVETQNIIRHLRAAGVEIRGAAPATVRARVSAVVPSTQNASGIYVPNPTLMPLIVSTSTFVADSGVTFNLDEDIDFRLTDEDGKLVAEVVIFEQSATGTPTSFLVTRTVGMISGVETEETFSIPDIHIPFRELTLSNSDVSDILKVYDSDGDEYYEVQSLSQDTVFVGNPNESDDNALVPMSLEIVPAPKRFVIDRNPSTDTTVLRFGSGDANTLDDDIIPDPSDLSMPLFGKRAFSRFSIDPNMLMRTSTLGQAPRNTNISVVYRYGGGLTHNISAGTLNTVGNLEVKFKGSPAVADAVAVRASIAVRNNEPARGADNSPTLEELRSMITASSQLQGRIVTKQDLLARIHTLPAKFGRVYRASIRQNPANPLGSLLYICSRDRAGNIGLSPDSLKKNLAKYLNEFRCITDSYDILDAQVINFGIKFGIVVAPNSNKTSTINKCIQSLKPLVRRELYQIDQPLVFDDFTNVIINTPGVLSLSSFEIIPRVGRVDNRVYSLDSFVFRNSTKNRILFGPAGSIFELKFPNDDIIGSAV